MFIAVTLEIPWEVRYGSVEPRNDFWSRFEAVQRNPERHPDGSEPIPEKMVAEYERQFRFNFPPALARYLNDELGRAVKHSKRSVKDVIGSPELEVRLLTLEYGSITAVMDIVGISNADLRDFVLATLNVYAPAAFRDVMNSQVTLTASSTVIGRDLDPTVGSSAEQASPSKGLAALG
ncbi:hypothetical protein MEX01_38330 [Methylorubrum extorquens]|uniref:hypothetical protein n=1 Tax=Methylorubrum extorquens TaxID=408 RepID=UPI00117178B5|nr:hypothetical protein [Methylorubrum extorquens]GEL43242.1 hypothetical protein MEX01_38330 [Methylorubrum extorquens]